jgi:hypothetical protein
LEESLKSDFDFEKKLIIEQLLDVPEGEMIEYSQLSALTGLDLQCEFRYLLDSSLLFVLKNHGADFRNIRNTGYKRLTQIEMAEDRRAQDRAIGACDKGTLRLTKINFDTLPDTHKRKHNAKLAGLALIKVIATEKSIMLVEDTMKDARATNAEARKALERLLGEM